MLTVQSQKSAISDKKNGFHAISATFLLTSIKNHENRGSSEVAAKDPIIWKKENRDKLMLLVFIFIRISL